MALRRLEFEATVRGDATLEVPPEVRAQFSDGARVRVILLAAGEDDADWSRLAAEQLLAGYDESDSR